MRKSTKAAKSKYTFFKFLTNRLKWDNMKKRSIIILILCFIPMIYAPIYQKTSGDTNLKYVVLYDESHGQHFNRTLMDGALASLNSLLPQNVTPNIEIELLFNTESEFNSTNLQGIDLLILTNPGIKEENQLTTSEIDAILDFVELGGSLFLLCNPLTQDENITGHVESINELLGSRDNKISSARIRTAVNASFSDVILDDFRSIYENDSYIHLNYLENAEEFIAEDATINETIFNQEVEIEEILMYSSSISLGSEEIESNRLGIATTPVTSYAVDETYHIFRDPVHNFLTWLLAKEITNSRVVLSGSTIMFSDMNIENNAWINQFDNLDLWKNIILWLLKYTPHPEVSPPAIWAFSYYALVVAAFSIVVFGYAFILYKYKNARKTSIKIKQ